MKRTSIRQLKALDGLILHGNLRLQRSRNLNNRHHQRMIRLRNRRMRREVGQFLKK
jgi:hypothetical protein